MNRKKLIPVISALALAFSERDLLASVITLSCPGAPLYDRVELAQTVITHAEAQNECIRDSVDALVADGRLRELGEISSVDRSSKEYRLSLDAVAAAEGGCGRQK